MNITFPIITLPPKGASAKKQIGKENRAGGKNQKDSKNAKTAPTSNGKGVHLPCKGSISCPYSLTDFGE